MRRRRCTSRGAARDEARLAQARELGFETSVAGEALDREPRVVIECSGSAAGIAFALESAARGGRLVQIGLAGKPVAIPFDLVCYRELTVTSGNASTPRSWRRALELIEARQSRSSRSSARSSRSREWERAFAATREGSGIKFVLDPSI